MKVKHLIADLQNLDPSGELEVVKKELDEDALPTGALYPLEEEGGPFLMKANQSQKAPSYFRDDSSSECGVWKRINVIVV